MKLERHILTILLIALLFVLIGSVSAADTNDTQTVSASGNDEILSVGNDVDILGDGEYSYTQLKDQFRFDGDITLIAGNYTYVSGDGNTIEITTSRVIDGNGAVIDMANSGNRAFFVMTDGVTIKNLTIKNANFNGNGGAIYFSSSGTVENCNFINNKATSTDSRGGAVYFYQGTGSVSNCNFTDNTAYRGGAVYFLNTGNVTNCNFTNNTANYGGGAVYFMDSGNVTNCNFVDNKAPGYSSYGGAIRMYSGTVTNCNFTNNTANYEGGAIRFSGSGTVTNCNFADNKATGDGGAVYFMYHGTVTNCNFTNNTAKNRDGGAINMDSGTVTNCNFTNNTAKNRDGGAVYFYNSGNVTNCNFINNKATSTDSRGGAVYFYQGTGSVSNCNFTNNQATGAGSWGGAIMFASTGTVTNCNFANNLANEGGAIFSYQWSTTADTCIFKSESDTFNNNVVIVSPKLNVDNFTTFYGSCEKLTFNLTTDSGMPVNNGNISISVYFKNNNSWIGNYSCLSGEGWIPELPVGSYYAIFETEYAEFQPINRTIKIIPNIPYYANVTSIITNNRTVNITAKSNIPNEVIKGKLLFILPNSTEINATYASNGTWWALHTFDDVGDYNISASYIGLDDVIINNGNISIRYEARVDVNNKTLNLEIGQNFTIVATTTPEGLDVTYVQDDSGVYIVDKNGVVTALKNGTGSVLVQIGGDGIYAKNSTIVNVTVSKVPTEISVLNDTLDLKVDGVVETGATLTPADAGNLTYTVSNPSIVKVENGKITALKEGNATITVSFAGNKKYLAAENKTINVTVSLNDASVSVNNDTLDLLVDDKFNLIATTEPKDLTVNYTSSNPSVVTVDNEGNVVAIGEGTATITVSVGGDAVYAENSTTVTVTVSKVPTEISVNPASLDLLVGNESSIAATLTPAEAGNVTFTSSDKNIVTVDNQGNVIAVGEGNATITVSFTGDNKYASAENKTIKVTVKKLNPIMDVNAEEITEGENATISVTLPGDATGNVSLIVNGKTYTAPVNNGEAVITVPGLTENVTAVINYPGDDKYNSAVTTVNITVNRNTVTITAENLTKYYRDSQKFTVKVTDAKGQAAANKTMEITINGVTYKRTTDENGTAGLNINLNSGEYPVSVAVDDVTVNSTVTVMSTIDASDVVKMFRNDTQYNAIFTDVNGTALANITVSFNINGIIYNRTTDAKGGAKLNINLNAGDYIVTAFNPVTGEMKSNTIKVISLIESDDLTKYYRNASQFVVRIHSADGGYVGAGETVTFNINGVLYTRTTNATGHAKLNINLAQGNYTITTYYKDCSQGNEITVLPVLSADDLVMKYKDGSQFKAKLVDGQGKAYVGQGVQFNINGVFYNRGTDDSGIAKLNINLMPGEYIITSSYNGSSIANKVTVNG